jgi:hypothetical protein
MTYLQVLGIGKEFGIGVITGIVHIQQKKIL